MKILVIEDSRLLRSAMEKVLAKAGHDVVAAGDGQQGLRLAQELHPDVILLDMMLPSLDGTEVLRQLKKAPLTRHIPVIVLSALAQKNEMKLKLSGAAAYFEKSNLRLDDDGVALLRVIQGLATDVAAAESNPL
jgi:CheY-like chemotaxis protein